MGGRLDRGLGNFDSLGKRTISSRFLPSHTKDEATSLCTCSTHIGGRALIHKASDLHRACRFERFKVGIGTMSH